MKNLQFTKAILLFTAMFIANFLKAQLNVTTTNSFLNNNGTGTVTFNLYNSNSFPIIIQEIQSITSSSGTLTAEMYFHNNPVNGSPGAINAGNGWNLVASGTFTGIPNSGSTVTQPILSGLNIIVAPFDTIGVAVFATGQRYFTHPGGTSIDSAFGVQIITGTNIGYAGGTPPAVPGNHPRGWVGTIRFIPAISCSGTPFPGNAISSSNVVCIAQTFNLSLINDSIRQNLRYQWLSSSTGTPGSYTLMANDTTRTIIKSQSATTWYRCIVSCGTNADTSSAVQVITPTGTMTGTYTINPSLPLSSTNFHRLSDAVSFLNCAGMSGSVVINFAPGIGNLTDQISFGTITGSSPVNTITINGNGNTIIGTSTPIVSFVGTKHLIWDSLNVVGSPSFSGFAMYFGSIAEDITIRKSRIDIGITQTATTHAAIVVSGSNATATTAGNNGRRIRIENNQIIGGYYGIIMMGTASYLHNHGHIIRNNIIRDFHLYGIYLANADTVLIENNDLSRLNRTTYTTFYGIYGTTTRNIKVINNKIRDSGPGSYTAYPIWFATSVNSVGFETEIYNNLVYNITTTGLLYGLYFSGTTTGFKIYHNTVVDINSSSTGARRSVFFAVAPNNVDMRNNIFSMSGSGSGAKFSIYVTTISPSFTANRNVYHFNVTNGTNVFGFWGANNNTLLDWQTASGRDSNSVNIDPNFLNIANGLLIPLSGSIDSLGRPVGVLNDITGALRNSTHPDAGAYEFNGVTSDLSIRNGYIKYANGCANVNDTLRVTIANNIGSNINFSLTPLTIHFSVTGPVNTSGSFVINSGTLNLGSEQEFTISSAINRSLPGNYNATVFIPFSTLNNLNINDTIRFSTNPSLSGTINVNASSANYPNIKAAIDSLVLYGVCGPVVVNIAPNTPDFTSNITIENIPGINAINNVTINGNGNRIVTNLTPIVRFNGASHVILDSLQIIGGSGFNGFAIHIGNQTQNITIRKCNIDAGTSSTSTLNAAIVASGATGTATTAGNNARNIQIINNIITGGYYGIIMVGEASYLNNFGHIIRNNIIKDFYLYGLYLANADGVIIDSNDINRATRTGISTFYGFYGLTVRNIKLLRNRIHDAGVGAYTAYPIWYSTSVNNTGQESDIINNAVYNINTTGASYGLYFSGTTTGFKIYHNTIEIDGSGTGTKRVAWFGVAPNSVDFRNNILALSGAGTGTKHLIYVTTTSTSLNSNNNVLFMGATGGSNHIGYWVSDRTTLLDWQSVSLLDSNSNTSNPVFANLIDGNITPLSVNIDNMGVNVGVPRDINGSLRSTTTPDVGSVEFTGISGDLSIQNARLIRSSQCYSMFDTIRITINNVIGGSVNLALNPTTVVYQITGPINTFDSIVLTTGTIPQNGSITISNNNINMSSPGTYSLMAYLRPSSVNNARNNDTLNTPFQIQVRPIISVTPKTGTANSPIDTFILRANSPLFPGGNIFITEICHWRLSTTGPPTGGWPGYLLADDYIEVTGVPNTDLAGFTLEEWTSTGLQHSATFPTGTLFSPNGTMIIATGQLGSSIPSPSNFYYHSGNTVTHSSTGDDRGYLIRGPGGNVIDATVYGNFVFPPISGVTVSDWTGITPAVSSAGNRLAGPDINSSTNWINSGVSPQNPNVLNSNVPLPTPGSLAGFNWFFLGTPIDTNPIIKVGPYTTPGIYRYVANYNTLCGIFTDTVTITATQNVPVTLTRFNAVKNQNDIVLTWQTASEINNDFFAVERSVDGNSFETIGHVKGKGNTSSISNYRFTDNYAVVALSGNSHVYYRLNQFDFDGTNELSNVVSVALNNYNNEKITAVPNPNSGNFDIKYSSSFEGNAKIEVVDMVGNIVASKQIEVRQSMNMLSIDENLRAGIYTIVLTTADNRQSIKVIVSKTVSFFNNKIDGWAALKTAHFFTIIISINCKIYLKVY